MKRIILLLFYFSSIFFLMISCNEIQPTFEIKTKVTNDLNYWQTNGGSIRTMQKDHFDMWAVNIEGSKTIFTGTTTSLTGNIYGDNTSGTISISTKEGNNLNEWIYYTGDPNQPVLYVQTEKTDDWNLIQVNGPNHFALLELNTIYKNDLTGWNITMHDQQTDILTNPHFFGLYLVPVLIAVNHYY